MRSVGMGAMPDNGEDKKLLAEIAKLKAENAELKEKLADRQLHIENAGSIAQAALELNKVF